MNRTNFKKNYTYILRDQMNYKKTKYTQDFFSKLVFNMFSAAIRKFLPFVLSQKV